MMLSPAMKFLSSGYNIMAPACKIRRAILSERTDIKDVCSAFVPKKGVFCRSINGIFTFLGGVF